MLVFTAVSAVACQGSAMPYKEYASVNNADDYNKNLYYLNELKF